MNVIITGATGFLGKHTTKFFIDKRWNVVGFGSRQFDLRKSSDCEFMLKQGFRMLGQIDCVVNLAANVGGIEYNINNPYNLFYDNLMINTNLINTLCQYPNIKLIQIGTTCSYPAEPKTIPFIEGELFDGYPEESNASYGLAKRMSIVQLKAAEKQFGLYWICLIPTNLYGPGDCFEDDKSHVIPALIKKFVTARKEGINKVNVWGDGMATRDFLYVEDAVKAIYYAIKDNSGNCVYNVGSGEEYSIRYIARKIKSLTKFGGDIFWDLTKPSGQKRRLLDNSKIYRFLNWEPSYTLQKGLEKTIWWYEENYA